MDPRTVIAICDLLLVVIGIIGLVQMRKERRTVLVKEGSRALS